MLNISTSPKSVVLVLIASEMVNLGRSNWWATIYELENFAVDTEPPPPSFLADVRLPEMQEISDYSLLKNPHPD